MSRKSVEFLATKGAYIDNSSGSKNSSVDHGKLWMKVTKKAGSIIVATWRLATKTRTILPDTQIHQ